MNYGPYDNGHLILGMESGLVLMFDSLKLSKLHQIQMADNPITAITFDPTNLILVASKDGELSALSMIQNPMHYVYLDLGEK